MIAKLLYHRPRIEAAISSLDKARLKLRVANLPAMFDNFDSQPVVLTELPFGPWSSPVADIVMLAKIALCTRPLRVLEVGSFRGYTAKLLATHTPPEAHIVAIDRDPEHGAAYRDSPLAEKIERRVNEVSHDAFVRDARGSYHLIFIDADHTYNAVKRDTEILLPLLAPNGIVVWHDYANWGRFSKKNGVPEYLHELAMTRPVVAVGGSWLAAHMPGWTSGIGAERLAKALQTVPSDLPGVDPWTVDNLRG